MFDYSDPPASLSQEMHINHDRRVAHVTELGEAWVSYFKADEPRAKLMALGFSEVEDLGPPEIATRYFSNPLNTLPETGGHILRATTI